MIDNTSENGSGSESRRAETISEYDRDTKVLVFLTNKVLQLVSVLENLNPEIDIYYYSNTRDQISQTLGDVHKLIDSFPTDVKLPPYIESYLIEVTTIPEKSEPTLFEKLKMLETSLALTARITYSSRYSAEIHSQIEGIKKIIQGHINKLYFYI